MSLHLRRRRGIFKPANKIDPIHKCEMVHIPYLAAKAPRLASLATGQSDGRSTPLQTNKVKKAAKKYKRVEIFLPPSGRDLPHKQKRCPIVGVRVLLAQFEHRAPQGQRLVMTLPKSTVEGLHKAGGRRVMDVPQSKEQALRSGRKEAPNEAYSSSPPATTLIPVAQPLNVTSSAGRLSR